MESRPTKKQKVDNNKSNENNDYKKSKEPNSNHKKIDYSKINLDDYKNIDLKKYKDYLYQTEYYHNDQIKKIKKLIKETNIKMALKCKEDNGDHEWISERENCMYGERFTFCKNCKIDAYDNTYTHY